MIRCRPLTWGPTQGAEAGDRTRTIAQRPAQAACRAFPDALDVKWLREVDLHHRPSAYETDELTTAPPRKK